MGSEMCIRDSLKRKSLNLKDRLASSNPRKRNTRDKRLNKSWYGKNRPQMLARTQIRWLGRQRKKWKPFEKRTNPTAKGPKTATKESETLRWR